MVAEVPAGERVDWASLGPAKDIGAEWHGRGIEVKAGRGIYRSPRYGMPFHSSEEFARLKQPSFKTRWMTWRAISARPYVKGGGADKVGVGGKCPVPGMSAQ